MGSFRSCFSIYFLMILIFSSMNLSRALAGQVSHAIVFKDKSYTIFFFGEEESKALEDQKSGFSLDYFKEIVAHEAQIKGIQLFILKDKKNSDLIIHEIINKIKTKYLIILDKSKIINEIINRIRTPYSLIKTYEANDFNKLIIDIVNIFNLENQKPIHQTLASDKKLFPPMPVSPSTDAQAPAAHSAGASALTFQFQRPQGPSRPPEVLKYSPFNPTPIGVK